MSAQIGKASFVRRWHDAFPLTWIGAIVLVFSFFILFWVYTRSYDHVLRIFALGAVALVVLSVVHVLALALLCHLRIKPESGAPPLVAICGLFAETGFVLPIPASFGVQIEWASSARGQQVRFRGRSESVCFSRRGVASAIERKIMLTDCFGFASVTLTKQEAREVEVCPAQVEPTEPWQASEDAASGDDWSAKGRPEGDRLDIGQYRQGDSMKDILWKLTAKRGGTRIYVRRPETVETKKTAYYFLAGPGDDQAAELAAYLLRSGQVGPNDLFRCSSDGDDDPTDPESASSRLMLSGQAEKHNAGTFLRFAGEAARQQVGVCVVIIPPSLSEESALAFADPPLTIRYVTAQAESGPPPVSDLLQGVEAGVVKMREARAG